MAAFVLFATAFIVSSTWQIVAALFFLGGVGGGGEARAAGRAVASAPCAAAIRELEAAIDRARVRAAAAHDEAEAGRLFNDALDADDARAADGTASGGARLASRCDGPDRDFSAAALRLRSAAEAAARREAAEIGRVQGDVDAVLPR